MSRVRSEAEQRARTTGAIEITDEPNKNQANICRIHK